MRVQIPTGPWFIFTILKRINYKCLKAESFVVNSVSNGVENAWKRKSHDFHNVNRSRLTLSTNRCSPLKCFAVIVAKMLWLYFPNLVVLSWFDCTFWLITNLTVLSRFYLRFWINSYSADPFHLVRLLVIRINSTRTLNPWDTKFNSTTNPLRSRAVRIQLQYEDTNWTPELTPTIPFKSFQIRPIQIPSNQTVSRVVWRLAAFTSLPSRRLQPLQERQIRECSRRTKQLAF